MSQETTRPVGHYYAKALGFDKPVILYWDGENWNCDLPTKIEASHVTVLRPVPEYQESVEEWTVEKALETLADGRALPDGMKLVTTEGYVVENITRNADTYYPFVCTVYEPHQRSYTCQGKFTQNHPSELDLELRTR